ncbi:hypothetical protein [Moorena sp. SIO3H5]|nr:hypothetical protein [Moorena sp. SIO3H5]
MQRRPAGVSPIRYCIKTVITINFSNQIVKSYHCSLFPVPCSLP